MNNRIEQLTFTRFISAIFIFIGHFNLENGYISKIVPNLWINFGVTYFFVLSGFVLTINYENRIKKISKKVYYDFIIARLARIYPIYFLSMCLSMYVGMAYNNEVYSYSRVIFNIFLLQAWHGPFLINFPSWSLSCEFFFYNCFLFLLLRLKRVENKYRVALIACVYLLSQLCIIILFNILNFNLGSKLNPLFHILHFIIGIITALIHNDVKKIEISPINNISIVCMIVVLVMLLKPLTGFEPETTPLYVLFILLISHKSFPLANFLSKKTFVLLGNVSFGIYIFQGPLVTIIERMFKFDKYILNGDLRLLLLATIVTLICVVVYVFIEKPLQKVIVNHFK